MNPLAVESLLRDLQARFEKHVQRHPDVRWADVRTRLEGRPAALRTLCEMEATGGEPDVVSGIQGAGHVVFCDCSSESPAGRRSLCYDRAALDSRKENRPEGCVVDRANAMGVVLLTEAQYGALQEVGEFDTKTSSWVLTPPDLRAHGGALFCDRRYGRVFTYHNGAQSYYAARGFRGLLEV